MNKNEFRPFLVATMLLLCFGLVGCNKFNDNDGGSPQFVVTSITSEDGVTKVHPLFAFSVDADRSCQVTYVDIYGKVLCCVTGADLPRDVTDYYRRRFREKRCSGDAMICVLENGQIKLTREELIDIAAIIRVAPPDPSVVKSLHPTLLSTFEVFAER